MTSDKDKPALPTTAELDALEALRQEATPGALFDDEMSDYIYAQARDNQPVFEARGFGARFPISVNKKFLCAIWNAAKGLLAAAREAERLRSALLREAIENKHLAADAAAQRARAERAMRPFPILGDKTRATIPWCVAEVAYEDYKRRFGDGQTLERIAERGGFCPLELIEHLGLKAAAERAAKEGK